MNKEQFSNYLKEKVMTLKETINDYIDICNEDIVISPLQKRVNIINNILSDNDFSREYYDLICKYIHKELDKKK